MERVSFKDMNGKKGELGSKVIDAYYGKEVGEVKTVKRIISKGAGGTRLYFEEGGYGKTTHYKIIE